MSFGAALGIKTPVTPPFSIPHTRNRGFWSPLDKDFGELAILKEMSHSGIIQLTGFRASQMAAAIHHIVTTYAVELTAGAIVTVDPERIRIRPH